MKKVVISTQIKQIWRGWPRGVLETCATGRPADRGLNPNADRFVYYLFPRLASNEIIITSETRGIPLAPTIISRGEIQGVKKILLNGDWQSSLDRSTPTVES